MSNYANKIISIGQLGSDDWTYTNGKMKIASAGFDSMPVQFETGETDLEDAIALAGIEYDEPHPDTANFPNLYVEERRAELLKGGGYSFDVTYTGALDLTKRTRTKVTNRSAVRVERNDGAILELRAGTLILTDRYLSLTAPDETEIGTEITPNPAGPTPPANTIITNTPEILRYPPHVNGDPYPTTTEGGWILISRKSTDRANAVFSVEDEIGWFYSRSSV